jgi:hypothetical protein
VVRIARRLGVATGLREVLLFGSKGWDDMMLE